MAELYIWTDWSLAYDCWEKYELAWEGMIVITEESPESKF